MTWIKSHMEVARHPKIKRLARILNVSIPAAIGHVHLLWWWSIEYVENGDLTKYEAADIADAMLWEDDPEELMSALKQAGFVDENLCIHDWEEHQGALLKRREDNRQRAKESYEKKKKNRNDYDTESETF